MLLCLDLSNLVARHYHSRRADPICDTDARPITGALGTLRQIAALIRSLEPTHLLVARDGEDSNRERRALYTAYKAHRSRPDEDLLRNLDLTCAAMQQLRWPVVEHAGWEGDDVIASACAAYRGRVVIVSGDKDMFALCSDRVRLRLLRNGQRARRACGPADCVRELGVYPHQVRSLKALAGDQSDGIPGVRGIGHKTAVALLNACDTLTEIYDRLDSNQHIDGLRGGQARMLRTGRDMARLSWRLAGLNHELPIDVSALQTTATLPFRRARTSLRALGLQGLFDPVQTGRAGRLPLPKGVRAGADALGPTSYT